MTSPKHFDLVSLGCGPAGERAAILAARSGKRVAVVERAPEVGGNRINWGTIPSKTLRESALFVNALTRNRLHGIRCEITDEITVADFMYRERLIVRRELDLINASLDKYRIEILGAHGRFVDPHTIELDRAGQPEERVTADVVLIATGSRPNRPANVPFDGEVVFDSESILSLPHIPRRMLVLGAGVIGVEYASIFAALGVTVTLLDTREKLLPYLDREVVTILAREMGRIGVTISHNERAEKIERIPGSPPRVLCETRKGIKRTVDVLLYCVGRDGNTKDLGLETLGIAPNAYGLLEVNASYQTVHPHIYAVGDVIGYPALASTSMDQGRRAVRHAFGIEGPTAHPAHLPFAIYSIPEISYVGPTEEKLKEQGIDYVVGRGNYELNPRGLIAGDDEGLLKLLFAADTGKLLGAHVVGHSASELIHLGMAYVQAGTTAREISESIFNYPTLSDLYRHAALTAATETRKRGLRA